MFCFTSTTDDYWHESASKTLSGAKAAATKRYADGPNQGLSVAVILNEGDQRILLSTKIDRAAGWDDWSEAGDFVRLPDSDGADCRCHSDARAALSSGASASSGVSFFAFAFAFSAASSSRSRRAK
jgi:hypothetical protein